MLKLFLKKVFKFIILILSGNLTEIPFEGVKEDIKQELKK
jgi:hypothetical protein